MIHWWTPARADVAVPQPPVRGTVAHDLPPPEAPPGELPAWLPGGIVVLAALLLGAFLVARARRRAAG